MAIVLVIALAGGSSRAADVSPKLDFEHHVRPIFKAYCFECHGEGEKLRGGLDLRLRRLLVQGGDTGPGIVPGKAAESLLIQKVRSGEMPPSKKKLPPELVEILARWVAEGAITAGAEPAQVAKGWQATKEERAFWSFQPIRHPAIPVVKGTMRVRTPIDALLLHKLEAKGLSFAPDADRKTLIRRAYFDLLGLPPSPEEVASFVADPRPDAYEHLLDRLLESPHYGERWGRHWLDVAGYADSEGVTSDDLVRPDAYKYRDYVLRAFNADKPFDQFIVEQLAGDELVKPPFANMTPETIEKLTATGFLRMAPDGTGSGGVDQNLARNEVVANTIRIVTTSLLGLSVGCAQCHNHRYDPIPQTDYYRFRALFEPALNWKAWQAPAARRISLTTDADRAVCARIEAECKKLEEARLVKQAKYIEQTLEKQLAKVPAELRDTIRKAQTTAGPKRTPEQNKLLKEYPFVNVTDGTLYLYDHKAAADLKKDADAINALRATKPPEEFLRALTEPRGPAPPTFLFNRGDIMAPKQVLPPGGLAILDDRAPLLVPTPPANAASGRRLALARWIIDGKNPLTARVLVNRIWLHHFGKGLVTTPGDFGFLGERPNQPELLDWLAADFVAGGWKMKRFHKLLMRSTAYRQSSRRDPTRDALDPDNRLLARMNVRRLEAEAIRDAILCATGKLNPKLFGKPVPVMEDDVGQIVLGIENKNGERRNDKPIPLNGEEFRRSVYVQVRRSKPLAMLDTFDLPTMEPNCECRIASTVTPQALMFLNNEFVVESAGFLAERGRREAGQDTLGQVRRIWSLCFGVGPNPAQEKDAVAFLTAQTEHFRKAQPPGAKAAGTPDPTAQALASLCQTLLSANAFLYVD